MKHARADYNRLQDPEGKIPMEEPVFIIRGQDNYSGSAILAYADLVEVANPQLAGLVRDWARFTMEWSPKKDPDLGPCQGFQSASWTERCIWCGHFEDRHCDGGG